MVTGHGGVCWSGTTIVPSAEELGGRTLLSAFAGGQKDGETATTSSLPMDYFGARHLAGALGRFTAVDPGHVGGSIDAPQSWNGYGYAGNNPLRFVDPSGTDYVAYLGSEAWEVPGSFDQFRRWIRDQGWFLGDGDARSGDIYRRLKDQNTGTSLAGSGRTTSD